MAGRGRAPDVTAVVPTHNRSGLLVTTLRSVLWQRDVDPEVIVVDDGSTDDTADVVAGFGDPRMRLVRHEIPQGVAAARNRGVSEARGEWVAFCDDDDLWAPDKLARQVAAARRTGRDWVYTGAVNVTPGLRVIGGAPPPPPERVHEGIRRVNLVPGGGSGVLVHRGALARAGPFDTRLYNTEDWEMWIRLARLGPPAWVCAPLVGYRIHPGTASFVIAETLAGAALIERRHGHTVDRLELYRHAGRVSLRGGRRRDALRHYLRAAMLGDPRYLSTGLPADLKNMAVGMLAGVRRHAPPSLSRLWGSDRHREPYGPWREQAREWVDLLGPA